MKRLLSLSLLLLLSACGGGGSDDNDRSSRSSIAQSSTASFSRNSSSGNTENVIVTPVVSGNGQIQPSGLQVVTNGNQISFTLTPDTGSYIANISGCGGSLQNQTYTTVNLFNDCEIIVQFSEEGFVFIPDLILKNAIQDELNLSNSSEITPVQMQNLTSLTIDTAPQTLTGLEAATNLESLQITSQTTVPAELNLSPLSSLTKIEDLSLQNIHILDSSVIQNFTNLMNLRLIESTWDDLEAITNLQQLRSLDIAYTNINDIGFLSDNNLLNRLNITGTPIYDLTPLVTSGLGSSDILLMNYTCVNTGKYSNNTSVINQLRSRDVFISNNFQNTGLYAEDKICPNLLTELTASVNAIYSATDLQINWQLAAVNESLVCEIYADLQGQQPRTPLAVIDDCESINSVSISSAFSNSPISLKVWNHFGSSRLFTASITPVSHTTAYLHSFDWGQTIVKSDAKLIPNKSALLRLHILSSQPTPVPDIQVQATTNSVTTNLTVIKPSQLPASKNFNSTNQSYRVAIDQTLMQPGMTIRIAFDGNEKVITPHFGIENTLNITLVPIRIENTLGIIPSHNNIRNAFLQMWPFSEVNLTSRLAYTSTADNANDMENVLYEIQELQILDGDNSHYYGFFSNDIYNLFDFNGFGGIAFIGDTTAIGKDNDPVLSTMLHEVGHNFNLQHINCGGPSMFDPLYPYSSNSIGSLGISKDLGTLFQPTSRRDIMSYCQPEFISDYSYEKAQDYIETNPSQPFSVTANQLRKVALSPIENNWFISGVINSQSANLRRLLPVNKTSTLNQQGQYKLRIFNQQLTQHDYYFDTKIIDHPRDKSEFFSLIIPYIDIASLEIWKGEQLLYKESDTSSVSTNTATQYQKVLPSPVITQTAADVCLNWDTVRYDSATLILHHNETQSTIFMDATADNHCVNFENITGTQWQILLRKKFKVDEFWQDY